MRPQGDCLQGPKPRPQPSALTPPARSVTRQHLNSGPIELSPVFLQVNEISCLLWKTLTLLVKETQWLAKSTHRSRKRFQHSGMCDVIVGV